MQDLRVAINGAMKNKDANSGSLTVNVPNKGFNQIHVGFTAGEGVDYGRTEEAQVSIWVDGSQLLAGTFDRLKNIIEEHKQYEEYIEYADTQIENGNDILCFVKWREAQPADSIEQLEYNNEVNQEKRDAEARDNRIKFSVRDLSGRGGFRQSVTLAELRTWEDVKDDEDLIEWLENASVSDERRESSINIICIED